MSALLLCLLLQAPPAPVAAPRPPAPAAPLSEAERLVRELGDERFKVREEAARKLARMGYDAFPALIAGLGDGDSERAFRCRRLLPSSEWWRDPKALAFVVDPRGGAPGNMPQVRDFLGRVGDTREGRELYAEMFAAYPKVLLKLADPGDELGELLPAHRETTLKPRGLRFELRLDAEGLQTRAGTTLFLYLVCAGRHDTGYQLGRPERTPLGNPRLHDQLQSSAPLRQLFVQWVRGESSPYLRRCAAEVLLSLGVPEGPELLPELARMARTQAEVGDVAQLLVVAAKHHPAGRLTPVLEPLLGSARAAHPRVRLGDVALGVLLQLHQQSLTDAGFPAPAEEPPHPLAEFALDEAGREKALQAWQRVRPAPRQP